MDECQLLSVVNDTFLQRLFYARLLYYRSSIYYSHSIKAINPKHAVRVAPSSLYLFSAKTDPPDGYCFKYSVLRLVCAP